jgi:hypothetical protein
MVETSQIPTVLFHPWAETTTDPTEIAVLRFYILYAQDFFSFFFFSLVVSIRISPEMTFVPAT